MNNRHEGTAHAYLSVPAKQSVQDVLKNIFNKLIIFFFFPKYTYFDMGRKFDNKKESRTNNYLRTLL